MSDPSNRASAPIASNTYNLSSSTPTFMQVPLPDVWPNQIAADTDGTVWVDGTWPSTLNNVSNNYIYHLNTTSMLASYAYNSTNSYSIYPYGLAFPWDIVADTNYVYATDFGDGNLIQIEKNGPDPGQVNVVPLPFASDGTSGFGLALQANNLYFTAGPNFGVVNVGSWEAGARLCAPTVNCAPAPSSAVEYTGLPAVVDPGGGFNAIAVSPDGQIGILDYNKVTVRLVPALTTTMLVPSNGAQLSGTAAVLDAGASDTSSTVSNVQFEITGNGLSNQVVATAGPTLYGWIGEWNTTTVPDGTYTLESVATDAAGKTKSVQESR